MVLCDAISGNKEHQWKDLDETNPVVPFIALDSGFPPRNVAQKVRFPHLQLQIDASYPIF